MNDLVIKTYTHKGIGVQVRIDFPANEISILDGNRNPKQWIFQRRGIEYMQGWLNIFEALKYATKEAGKELEAYRQAKADERGEFLEAVFIAELKEDKPVRSSSRKKTGDKSSVKGK